MACIILYKKPHSAWLFSKSPSSLTFMGCVINSIWERVLCCTISSGESHHEPRHRASEGILKWNRQSFVISLPQSLFKLINTAVRWWTGLILYCWARPRLSNVILWVMPLDLLGIYFTCIPQMQLFNFPVKTCLPMLLFVKVGELIKIEPNLPQFHSHTCWCRYLPFCTIETLHKYIFRTQHFLICTFSKLCQTEMWHFKRPLVKTCCGCWDWHHFLSRRVQTWRRLTFQ